MTTVALTALAVLNLALVLVVVAQHRRIAAVERNQVRLAVQIAKTHTARRISNVVPLRRLVPEDGA